MSRRKKSNSSNHAAKNKRPAPGNFDEFFALSLRSQDRWTRMTHVITKMRTDDVSLQQAAREYGLDPRTVVRLSGPALQKRPNGRYAARASDRLLRVLVVPSHEGLREVAVRDSRQATLLGDYWNALQRYLETGDASALRRFRGQHIADANRKKVPVLTDLHELDRQGNAGNLSFESLYAKAG